MINLRVLKNTYLKPDTRQSIEIPHEQLVLLLEGETIKILEWGKEPKDAGHIWVKREGENRRWYAWSEHVKILEKTINLPEAFDLEVPYLSQLDNENNPTGSCNVTSVAMCLGYLGHPLKNSNTDEQLEDELYRYMRDNGLSRHSPEDLKKLINNYGYEDKFQLNAKWAEVKKWLVKGWPIIVHGWFTESGHIIVIKGFNKKGWIVNDPYGEWFSWGYDTTASGKNLTYSYAMMRNTCGPDGDLWIHCVSK